jgi:hypothetical protein
VIVARAGGTGSGRIYRDCEDLNLRMFADGQVSVYLNVCAGCWDRNLGAARHASATLGVAKESIVVEVGTDRDEPQVRSCIFSEPIEERVFLRNPLANLGGLDGPPAACASDPSSPCPRFLRSEGRRATRIQRTPPPIIWLARRCRGAVGAGPSSSAGALGGRRRSFAKNNDVMRLAQTPGYRMLKSRGSR